MLEKLPEPIKKLLVTAIDLFQRFRKSDKGQLFDLKFYLRFFNRKRP